MRFVQIEMLPEGKALIDIEKLTHAVPQGTGSRLFLGAQSLDVPHTLAELENVLSGRDWKDGATTKARGFASGNCLLRDRVGRQGAMNTFNAVRTPISLGMMELPSCTVSEPFDLASNRRRERRRR